MSIAFSWSSKPESTKFLVWVLRAALRKRKSFLMSCILLILYQWVSLYKGYSSPWKKVKNISVSQSSQSPPNNSISCTPQSWHVWLVIHYQWVGLYKGFSTLVEKSPSWPQYGWAGDTSLRLTFGRSLSTRPFAFTCQASPLVSHSGWFIRHSS